METQIPKSETEEAATLASELRMTIGKLKRRLREQGNLGDLNWSQLSVVKRLERDGPATVTMLARAESMRPQSMGANVGVLMAAGLVRGTPDPSDRRQTILSLTDACRELIVAGRAAREDWLQTAIANHLDAEEQRRLSAAIDLLKRLADA